MNFKTQNIPITFKNPIEASFSNKKYTVSNQTRTIQIENSIFLTQKRS